MITGDKLSGLFVEAFPSMRLSRPSLAAELSEWRSCFAQHFIKIKKSGPASESHIAYLLLERLFVDGDDEVREEARLLLQSIFAEAHTAKVDEKTLSKDFGVETFKAAAILLKANLAKQSARPKMKIRDYWGLLIGFTSWVPILVVSALRIHNPVIYGAAWVVTGVSLALGIRQAIEKRLDPTESTEGKQV